MKSLVSNLKTSVTSETAKLTATSLEAEMES